MLEVLIVFKSVRDVLQENITNMYRTIAISKYETIAEIKDSKLGIFWNFASPAIQVFTYWFVFGYVFNRKAVDGIPYIAWLLAGMSVWFFISPCITKGCSAIHSKSDIITKMKFPISILPLSVVFKELFEHACFMCIVVVILAIFGYYPSIHWLGLIYYLICAIIFAFAISLTTSVLTMLARDAKKLITSCMRLLLYFTPILWNVKMLPGWMQKVVSCNPIYYIVQGYRDCFFYHKGINNYNWSQAWYVCLTIVLFFFGSHMMCKFKSKFIDMI